MPVETAKDHICINQIIGQKLETIEVDGDVIVNDIKPDVLNIISADGIVSVYKKEIMDGKVRLDGNINTYIIYLAEDENGSIRSLNTTLDFTGFIDIENCNNGMTLDEIINIKELECNIINSRKINIKAKLEADVKVYSDESVEVISRIEDIPDIQSLNNEIEVNSLVGEGSTKTYAKDTISIDAADDLAEILQVKFKITDKDAKISYNKTLVKADCDISIMYLTEDNRINTINTKLPVMGFIDIPNIDDNNICDVKYKLKNLIVKANNMEKHSVYIEAEVEIMCCAYEMKYMNIIEDIYSTSSNLEFTKKDIRTISDKKKIKDTCEIKEKMLLPEIGTNRLYDVNVKPYITDRRIQKGKVVFEGEVELKILFESSNGMDIKEIEVPFNFEMSSDMIEDDMNIETNIEVSKENFIIDNGSCEAEIDLDFDLSMAKEKTIDIIEEIEFKEMEPENIYSMTVYFVKPEDSLWKIAKKLKSTIEDIQRVNEIEDENKIYVGQQLYIPKYVKRSIAI